MRILLVNQFFPPAQAPTGLLLAELAGELRGRGHEVTVITSASGYGAKGPPPPDLIRIIRLGRPETHRPGLASKFRDYFTFHHQVWRTLSALSPAPEIAVFMTTPPLIGLQGARLRKQCGIPYLLWCMDLYPEALAAHGLLRPTHPFFRLLERLARQERQKAAAVVALGPDMAELLQPSAGDRVVEIPVWSSLAPTSELERDARQWRRARGWDDQEVVCLYSGNMGRAHRAEEFAVLAEYFRRSGAPCRFVFSGAGPLRPIWEKQFGHLFEFHPAVPEEQCAAHLLSADIHLISQQPQWQGIVVPSKFSAACALGRPVLFAGPPQSAIGRWLNATKGGWILPPADPPAPDSIAAELFSAALRAEKGARLRRLYEQKFARTLNCATLAALIENTGAVKP